MELVIYGGFDGVGKVGLLAFMLIIISCLGEEAAATTIRVIGGRFSSRERHIHFM